MFHSKKSAFRTGIAVTALCVVLTLTAGCSVNSKKGNTAADVQNETKTVGKEQTTMAMAATEPAEPMKEPETAETHLTESSAAVPENTRETAETTKANPAETTEKETITEESTAEAPPVIEPMPGISAVSGYVTSGEQYREYWTDLSLEIAASLYKDFLPCAVEIDGIWKKGLYNEEHNLLVVQDDEIIEYNNADREEKCYTLHGVTYTIYHGDEAITVPVGKPFPFADYVRIELTDVTGDGKDELLIDAYLRDLITNFRTLVFHIDPFVLMTDVYNEKAESNSFVPQCRIVSAEATEEGMAKVQVEFILENGEKYVVDKEIEGADLTCLDRYEIYLSGFGVHKIVPWNNEESDEWELEAYGFGFDVEQPGIRTSEARIRIKIGIEYDDVAKRFRQGGDVTIE